jgi:hypothetical protein
LQNAAGRALAACNHSGGSTKHVPAAQQGIDSDDRILDPTEISNAIDIEMLSIEVEVTLIPQLR